MKLFKRDKTGGAKSTDRSRRSFFWQLGAGASTVLGATAAIARQETDGSGALVQELASLEDEKTVRQRHRYFEEAIDHDRFEEIVALFADDAEVLFDGDVFRGRGGVAHLYRNRFRSSKTGKRMEPAPGFGSDVDAAREVIEIAADRLGAKAQFPYSIQVGQPIETETSLADMARIHGEGVETWWEGGIYEVTYGRDAVDARWKIRTLEYRMLSRANYRPGRSYAEPRKVRSQR